MLSGFVIATSILSPTITLPGIDTFTFEVLLPDSSLEITPSSFLSAAMLTLSPASLSGASCALASVEVADISPAAFVIVAVALVSLPGSMATPPILMVLFSSVVLTPLSSISDISPLGAFETV